MSARVAATVLLKNQEIEYSTLIRPVAEPCTQTPEQFPKSREVINLALLIARACRHLKSLACCRRLFGGLLVRERKALAVRQGLQALRHLHPCHVACLVLATVSGAACSARWLRIGCGSSKCALSPPESLQIALNPLTAPLAHTD